MLLNLNGQIYDFQIVKASNFLSKHTLKELECLEVEIVLVGEEANEKLSELIDIARTERLTSVDNDNNVLKQWKIKRTSYTSNDKRFFTSHSLEIEEVELLKPSSLKIDELTIPINDLYYEYFNGDQLKIKTLVEITKEQQSLIKNMLNKEIPVVRYGIDEAPRQMTFLYGLWSEVNNIVKHEILLAEANKEAEDNSPWTHENFLLIYSGSIQSAANQALLDMLLNMLVDKEILNIEEVNKIYEDAINQRKEIIYNFYQIDDF
jgi:hypothetical protein